MAPCPHQRGLAPDPRFPARLSPSTAQSAGVWDRGVQEEGPGAGGPLGWAWGVGPPGAPWATRCSSSDAFCIKASVGSFCFRHEMTQPLVFMAISGKQLIPEPEDFPGQALCRRGSPQGWGWDPPPRASPAHECSQVSMAPVSPTGLLETRWAKPALILATGMACGHMTWGAERARGPSCAGPGRRVPGRSGPCTGGVALGPATGPVPGHPLSPRVPWPRCREVVRIRGD